MRRGPRQRIGPGRWLLGEAKQDLPTVKERESLIAEMVQQPLPAPRSRRVPSA